MPLSVCIICCNEEANIARTLESVVEIADEIILVDSGSTDRTLEIARDFGPKVKIFIEPWKGFAPQKNSALQKAACDWILSLDADESLTPELSREIAGITGVVRAAASDKFRASVGPHTAHQWKNGDPTAYRFPRRNIIFGRWIRHGGFYPDPKLRLLRRGTGSFDDRLVHEDLKAIGVIGRLHADFIHHAHPTIAGYLEHVNRYTDLGARMEIDKKGPRPFSVLDIVVRPAVTFLYNYFFRLGFLDGREGLLLHLYHAVYVSLKYSKAWQLSRASQPTAKSTRS